MRLKGHRTNGGCPRRRGPRIDYVCCDYDYNRCEIDLFTKLERHKEATNALESLLHSKECVQESELMRVSWDNCQLQVQQKLAASFSSGQMKYGHVVLLK